MLSAQGLHKHYAGRPVLDDVDIDVTPGSITALLGSNGCGKSTLLRSLALLEPADGGVVSVDGHEYPASVTTLAPPPWPTITMVFQQLFLWPHLTIRRNITLAQKESGARTEERFSDVVRAFGLESLLDRYPNEVSLGQRQRVAL